MDMLWTLILQVICKQVGEIVFRKNDCSIRKGVSSAIE